MQQRPMPFFVQRDTAVGIAPGQGQLPVYLSQPGQPVGRNPARELQGQTLERGENGASLPHLDSIEAADAEPASHVRLEHTLADQAEEGLPDRSSADPELGGNLGVPHTGAGGEVPPMDAFGELAIDLIPEWGAGDNRELSLIKLKCILYTVFTAPSQVSPRSSYNEAHLVPASL